MRQILFLVPASPVRAEPTAPIGDACCCSQLSKKRGPLPNVFFQSLRSHPLYRWLLGPPTDGHTRILAEVEEKTGVAKGSLLMTTMTRPRCSPFLFALQPGNSGQALSLPFFPPIADRFARQRNDTSGARSGRYGPQKGLRGSGNRNKGTARSLRAAQGHEGLAPPISHAFPDPYLLKR